MIGEFDIEVGNDQPNETSECKISPTNKESDLSYFDTFPERESNTDDHRKKVTAKRIEGWL